MSITIAAALRGQPDQTTQTVLLGPPLSGPERNCMLLGETSERHAVFKIRLKESKPLEGLAPNTL